MDKIKSRRRSKLAPIARKRRNYLYLLLSILLAAATIYLFFSFPPDYKFAVGPFGLPVLPFFIISLIAFIFSTLTFIFIQKLQGVIISGFVFVLLLMRLVGLTHWIFLLLLIALLITVEYFVIKQK